MASIDTLADDILQLGKGTINIDEDALAKFGVDVALKLQRATEERNRPRPPKTLYMSEIGTPCLKQLWYKVHKPELAEPMQGNTLLKFLYGDLIEETVLCLAKASGHKVEMEQYPVQIKQGGWKINGRIDAVIDGVLVDVKSCSPFGFKKFKEGLNDDNDSFGYRMQLESYQHAGQTTPTLLSLTYATPMGFVAVDKQNGSVHYSKHEKRLMVSTRIRSIVEAVDSPTNTKYLRYDAVADGKSGNLKLPTVCSYCAFKQPCWKAAANGGKGLRGFSYASGPVFLVHVVKQPNVPEFVLKNTEGE